MGFIRGGLVVILSVILFLSFLIGNLIFTMTLSLEYENVNSELTKTVKELIEEQINIDSIIKQTYPMMQLYCENNSEFVFNEQGYTFIIPCEVVEEGEEAIINYGINYIVEDIYYQEYDCDFLNCFEESEPPFFLISEKAQNYFYNKFYWILVFSIILIAGLFFLVENKTNLPLIVGSLLIISSLLFSKFDWVISFILGNSLLEFIGTFFSQFSRVFLTSMIIGIIILIIGIILKLFVIGFKVSNFFEKFKRKGKGISKQEVKDVVKEEISKNKKGPNKKIPK